MSKPTELQEKPAEAPTVTPDADAPIDVTTFTPKSRGRELDDIVNERTPAPEPEPEKKPEPEILTPAKADDDKGEVIDEGDHTLPDKVDDIFSPLDLKPNTPDDDKSVPDDKKKKNLGLREAMSEANERIKVYENDNLNLKREVEELQKAADERAKDASMSNPIEHPDVKAIIAPWNDEMESVAKQMTLTGSDGAKLKQHAQNLVERYRDMGGPQDEGFEERRDELIATIEDNFPDDKKEIVGIIARGADTLNKATDKIAEIRENGDTVRSEQEFKQYEGVVANYNQVEETYFNPSEDMKETEPHNAKVVIARHMEASPEVSKRADAVKTFLRKVRLPLAPIKASDVRGMSQEQAATYAQSRMKNHQVMLDQYDHMVGDAFMALAMIGGMDELATSMREENQDYRKATPSLGDGGSVDDEREEGEIDVRNFDPGPSKLKI